ncbi:hypothetical protein SAMN05444161_8029 [Rhizobiales bacterium GAS191]|nr:hypothetical protein SAMN05444161_8029 [Rhizobiales bacterium GAS191]
MRTLLICSLAGTLIGCSCLIPRQALMGACTDPKRFDCFDKMAAVSRVELKPASSAVGPVAKKANAPLVARAAGPRVGAKATASNAGSTPKKAKPALSAKSAGRPVQANATASKAGAVTKKPRTAVAAKAAGRRVQPKATASKAGSVMKKAKAAVVAKAAGRHLETRPTPSNAGSAAKKAVAMLAPKVDARPIAQVGDTSDPVMDRAKATITAKLEDPASAEFVQMKRAVRKNTLGQPIDTICGRVKGKTASSGETREMPFLYVVKEDDLYIVDGGDDMMATAAYGNICK